MIQDLAEHRFDNQYHPQLPKASDQVLLYRKDRIFMREDGAFLTVRMLNEEDRTHLQYLFRVDDTAYFTSLSQPLYQAQGYAWQTIRTLRSAVDRVNAFAGVSGYQLWKWYQSHHFCGGCGSTMHHDEKERMLYCERCGIMEYPKICPAVIVAVMDGDHLLLTRYAGRSYRRDALIAGFCEIGECLEDTVRREVMEEAGLAVKHITYYKSQPWSFTDTLLCGFFCEVDGSSAITMDTHELSMARWVKREAIPDDSEGISLTGEMMRVFKEGGHLDPQTKKIVVK